MRLRAFGATIASLSGPKGGVARRQVIGIAAQHGSSDQGGFLSAPRKGIQMAKPKVRRAIIREWMALARGKRQSGQQALAFAKAAVERHSLPRSRRTPHDVIMGWLRPRTGRP